MALTFQQIVTLAVQIAKAPGFTSQAGQMLNAILHELAETYDFDAAYAFTTFNFNPALVSTDPTYAAQLTAGSGPYPLPTDYLRADRGDVFYTVSGVAYAMIPVDPAEFDATVQQAGMQSYPQFYTTVLLSGRRYMLVWPPASGTFPVFVRYQRLPADTANPETSAGTPWFPIDTYIYTRLAGEMMKLTGDSRWQVFLGDGPEGAQGILRRYLKMADDHNVRAKRVTLDRRRFGNNWSQLRNTKQVGW